MMRFYQIPNFNFKVLDNRFGPTTGLTFASWMAFAIPVMSVNLVLSWAWLYFQNWVTEKRRKSPIPIAMASVGFGTTKWSVTLS